jgi:hypothetical protein
MACAMGRRAALAALLTVLLIQASVYALRLLWVPDAARALLSTEPVRVVCDAPGCDTVLPHPASTGTKCWNRWCHKSA